jgi:outer membrane immunogenic protein
MRTKRILAAFAAFFAGASAAFAADAIQPSDAGVDWSGLYIGVYGAYGIGDSTAEGVEDAHPSDPFSGIHVGYLFNFDRFVVGIEADASLADLDDDIGSGASFITQDFNSIASISARIGVPIDNALLFVNAGWSWADTEYGLGALEEKKGISGPALGAGAQYAFSGGIIGRMDYTHYWYGTTTYDLATPVEVKNSADVVKVGVDYLFH